ncbi:MAG TPA: dephospho-CoA kinase [Sporichthyaceae bacterium]|jgi:dephospho-CoA kinase|nr:dephospho-CoA kinase [Sporichthyaceae bacterium]
MRIGLTGGIGSGKTTVTDLLAARGAVIVDSDLVAREVVAAGSEGLAAVLAEFGPEILAPDGEMDRAKVAAIVFADPSARARLNAIVHPRVRDRAAALVAAAAPGSVVVQAIPLLVEVGAAGNFDLVIVVDVDPETAVRRLVSARGMTEADARARIAAQADRAHRLAAADVVVDNTGPPEALREQVDRLWGDLVRRVG